MPLQQQILYTPVYRNQSFCCHSQNGVNRTGQGYLCKGKKEGDQVWVDLGMENCYQSCIKNSRH